MVADAAGAASSALYVAGCGAPDACACRVVNVGFASRGVGAVRIILCLVEHDGVQEHDDCPSEQQDPGPMSV